MSGSANNRQRVFMYEVVGYTLEPKSGYHTYFLLARNAQSGEGRRGKIAMACVKRSDSEAPLYDIGTTVIVEWSRKYKKFYIAEAVSLEEMQLEVIGNPPDPEEVAKRKEYEFCGQKFN